MTESNYKFWVTVYHSVTEMERFTNRYETKDQQLENYYKYRQMYGKKNVEKGTYTI